MPEPGERNDIVLDKVTFIYPTRATVKVIEDLDLTFEAGKVTAIVGPSGSGKSTIAAMLMRFYDPASGRVKVGNHDLRELNIQDYRRHVSLVDQEPVLFSGTIMENIRHGLLHKKGLSENEAIDLCYQAARDANAYDFIMSLPDGFDTKLGGAGATQLSGGQRQRISIARALVSEPSILLLDEPTSALDSQSEAVVLDALDKAKSKKGRTTIMIAHRLATVRSADKIVVVQNGHAVEEGTHESLLEARGAYCALVKSQRLLGANSRTSSLSSAKTTMLSSTFGIASERLIRRIRDISLKNILRQDVGWFQAPSHSPAALVSMLNMDTGHLSGLSGVILAKFQQRHETAYVEAAALATEACAAIKTVTALGRESDVTRLYSEAVDKPYRESLWFIVTGNFWLAFALAITYFVYALAYYWGSRQVTRAKSAALSVFKIHDQKPTIDTDSQPPSCERPVAGGSRASNGSKIEFRGQFVAFVGYSGAGKSSAVALLERFYDVSSGSIMVDDVDIRAIPVRDHRSRISLVSQEPCLFPGSIHFNVSLGVGPGKEVSRNDVERACKICGLHDFIMGLPEGYETNCGTNGSQLSVGQKQRVSLARALMRDPTILLLDEATSALDSHSEKLIQEAVVSASRGRTCIAVAHRLASIQMADCIYVFEKGKIVEQGRHEELVAKDGIYAGMSKQQSLE
ncbi:P-loop containing nucleoside triphosphate hydrolase protein [Tuber magnatum]|uniref:P-loop containing nucleoside triphosphate hydrolase protein n=1 Tax=Tuber magnatum TaxID=42249 RepID=A0A317SGY2_9PEZI|nr:P-loop containing nucleoside triphosphate hydrolase protein [Tuber magnatum]